jgi:hypothetical protein
MFWTILRDGGGCRMQTRIFHRSAANVHIGHYLPGMFCNASENTLPLKPDGRMSEMPADHVEQFSKLQHIHYADNRYALLLIFQAIDTAGNDGITHSRQEQ